MAVALQNYGCVISITIAEMIPMNQRICADNEIVQLDGNVAQDNRITVAFQNGCSVTERMIAEITAMNYQKIVPFATRKPTSNARIIAVYRSK